MDIEAVFKGMAKAKVGGRGGNMEVGLYEVEVKDIIVRPGEDPKKPGNIFVTEFQIVKSENEKHKPGSSGSWVLRFAWPATFGHITKFVYAMLNNIDPGNWEATKENLDNEEKRTTAEAFARAMCGSDIAKKELGEMWSDGMFIGQRLRLETKMQKTAPKPGQTEGGNFTVYNWSSVSAPEAEATPPA